MIRIPRTIAAIALAAGLNASAAQAQSLVGRWEGSSNTQQGKTPMTVTLDSTASGWKGSWSAENFGGGALTSIGLKGDTLSFSLSIESTTIDMQGTVSKDKKTVNGYLWIAGNEGGTFSLARVENKPPPTR